MADDMTMPNNGSFDPIAQYARLSERVENQGKDIIDLRSNMNTGFQNIQSALSALTNEFRGSTRTQWPVIWSAIGVSFAVLAAVGALAYRPVLSNQERMESAFVRLGDAVGELARNTVSRQEMDWRAARGSEDRTRQETAIADLRESSVTRNEWGERNRARDLEIADLGRRVDELRQDVGSVYGTRDVIIDLKKEIDNLRQRLNSRYPPP
jgi:hypothetical protein